MPIVEGARVSRCEGWDCAHPECARRRRREMADLVELGPMAHRRLEPTAAELAEAERRRAAAAREQRRLRREVEQQTRRDRQDPVVKYDGAGRPVRLSAMGMNREQRREWLREQRRTR